MDCGHTARIMLYTGTEDRKQDMDKEYFKIVAYSLPFRFHFVSKTKLH